MKTARVIYNGALHAAEPAGDGAIRLDTGRVVAEEAVEWLPPVAPRTTFALGLNYADHAKELAFKAPSEPLIFLKGPNTFIGHRSRTVRPADATHMHYECELAVVIGRPARNVSRAQALDYVAGYTVANDYAIRDYLENYYRPNLRVKNRDTCTPLGPWFVSRDEIGDAGDLTLRTTVNGQETQRGSTRDMIFDVPALIEHISGFMTLSPGDLILTGTPEGLADTKPGDEVVTEIEGIGRLVNTIVGEADYYRAGWPVAQGESMTIKHWIDGREVESRETFTTLNPATGEVITDVASGGEAEVDAAVRAKEAFPKWANTPAKERAKLMRKLGELIEKNVPMLAALETQDTGLPIAQTSKQLIPRASENFNFFAEVCVQMNGRTYPVDDQMLNYTLYQPVGVCAGVAVERAVHDRDVEDGAVPRARQHGRAEDVGTVAADGGPARPPRARSRHSAGRAERRAGLWRDGRRCTRATRTCARCRSPAAR